MITLIYRGPLAEKIGKKQEQIHAATISDALTHIKTQYGSATLKLAKSMLITLNATNIQLLHGYKTPLKDGDSLAFLPLAAGG